LALVTRLKPLAAADEAALWFICVQDASSTMSSQGNAQRMLRSVGDRCSCKFSSRAHFKRNSCVAADLAPSLPLLVIQCSRAWCLSAALALSDYDLELDVRLLCPLDWESAAASVKQVHERATRSARNHAATMHQVRKGDALGEATADQLAMGNFPAHQAFHVVLSALAL
jgi:hypothetical protein